MLDRIKVLYLNYGGIHNVAIRSIPDKFEVTEVGVDVPGQYSISLDGIKASSVKGAKKYFQSLLEIIADNNVAIDVIAIADLAHPLNNLVFCYFKNKGIYLTYDGTVNILNTRMGVRDYVKDILKKLWLLSSGFDYQVRWRLKNGSNILKCRQLYCLGNLIWSTEKGTDRELECRLKSYANYIIYVSIALDYFDINKYKNHEANSIKKLIERYNRPVKILYRQNIPEAYINNDLKLDRGYFKGLSAEEILLIMKPFAVAGDVSSTLFNVARTDSDIHVVSVGAANYCKNLEKVRLKYFTEAFRNFNIRIME